MPILGVIASSIRSYQLPKSFESIATTTVGAGGASSISFTSIPSGYTHLQIRAIARTNRNDANFDVVKMNFNSDTASNYNDHYLFGDGANAFSGGTADRAFIALFYVTTQFATSNIFGTMVIDILDYGNTNKFKTIKSLMGYDLNGSGYSSFCSGAWRSTSAVTSIQLAANAGTAFNQYSHFALYGVKGE